MSSLCKPRAGLCDNKIQHDEVTCLISMFQLLENAINFLLIPSDMGNVTPKSSKEIQ
ncbi:hypothetical protein SS1G_11791 [Sclerotinia sclerotiorum 1980 UF-70]|uniref:Uncharacterized protein n=1 Tax=Sclerotinia sclerotiorum (strain ATCC 18683 / 1980 / Ss-1) TaxID=665079 RepID=A7F3E5_SCLS1|nr:hypothetical protein SS1G_11791 [Sclerotinia sclerotiorum 1980 UF-70]EDN97266.1 hypothetical protein SS1G_11791 [Sclerotinia sclerotiorum 1980 UF-70]